MLNDELTIQSTREKTLKITSSSKKPQLRHQVDLKSKCPESFKTLSEIRAEIGLDICSHDKLGSDTFPDNQHSNRTKKVRTMKKKLVRQSRSVDDEFLDLRINSRVNGEELSSSTNSLKMIQSSPLNHDSNLDLFRSHPDKLNLKKRGPNECNCRVLSHKGPSSSSMNRLKDFEKMTIFEGKCLERNLCDFSSTESMVWLESELRTMTPKLFCINNLKPLNGILCDIINKDVESPPLKICDKIELQTDKINYNDQKDCKIKNTFNISNSLCSSEAQQTNLSENIFRSEWNHNFPSSCDLKAMIRDSAAVSDRNKSHVNVCHTNNSSEASLTSGTRMSRELSGESLALNKFVRKQSSRMTVEADVHVTPNPLASKEEEDCRPDYNPLALLENDLSLYQDFGLPTHLASMEDIN